MSIAPAREMAITRSARRATGGTTSRHSRIVAAAPGSGATTHVTSASVTTLAAFVRSGAVRASECSTSQSRASRPSSVNSLAARSPRRPSTGWVRSSTSPAQGRALRCARPRSFT
jgi:hypothetical protein